MCNLALKRVACQRLRNIRHSIGRLNLPRLECMCWCCPRNDRRGNFDNPHSRILGSHRCSSRLSRIFHTLLHGRLHYHTHLLRKCVSVVFQSWSVSLFFLVSGFCFLPIIDPDHLSSVIYDGIRLFIVQIIPSSE